ncbi:MAG: hypothetical protein EPN82_05725 [Bacteroidetes bacterium]|nr:MAG: hypothetical protein EPN82_05725 [Bacteroidota bacterium]
MKRCSILITALIAVIMLFCYNESKAQLTPGVFGLNTEFGTGASELSMLYTLSNNFEVGLGVGYSSEGGKDGDKTRDSKSTIGINAYGAYFLSKGDVNPYLTLYVGYMIPPKEKSGENETTYNTIDVSFAFGGQVFVTKNFAVYIEAGLDYNIASSTEKIPNVPDYTKSTNIMSLFTSAVGASLYFH